MHIICLSLESEVNYLARVNSYNTAGTYERLIQTEFVTKPWRLQFSLTFIEFNNSQRHFFHDNTILSILAKHIFAPTARIKFHH